jgi:hypothetical protein
MKVFTLCLLAMLLITLSSCHQLTTTIGNYNLPTTVQKSPTKRGETCAKFVYPFSIIFSNCNITVEKARQAADIKEIISIESENRYVYPLYSHRCIIVLGN